MATAIVSFARAVREAPIPSGDDVRTEVITFTASSVQSTLVAHANDGVVSVLADADAWFAVGPDPDALDPDDATDNTAAVWPLVGGVVRDFHIDRGHRVAVIERS